MGTNHHPEGTELQVSKPVMDYMIKNKLGEVVGDEEADIGRGGYARRDMQAEHTPAKPKRKRRNKAEMAAARAAGEK